MQAHVNFIFWMTSSSRWPRKCLAIIISDYFVMYEFIYQFIVIWKRIAPLESNNKLCEATCLPRNVINASESSTTMDSFSVLACTHVKTIVCFRYLSIYVCASNMALESMSEKNLCTYKMSTTPHPTN